MTERQAEKKKLVAEKKSEQENLPGTNAMQWLGYPVPSSPQRLLAVGWLWGC